MIRRVGAVVLALAGALSGGALEVSPEGLFFKEKPGTRARARLTLRNDEGRPVEVRLSVRGVAADGKKPWVAVSPGPFRLEAGERRDVPVRVMAPPGEGERTADVVAAVAVTADAEIRVVRRVRLVLAGTERYQILVEDVRATAGQGRVLVTAVCRNEGNITVRLKFGAELRPENGPPVSAMSGGSSAGLAPGEKTVVNVGVPWSGEPWKGGARLMAYYLDGQGRTVKVVKEITNVESLEP